MPNQVIKTNAKTVNAQFKGFLFWYMQVQSIEVWLLGS
jgi:hypothetical protein